MRGSMRELQSLANAAGEAVQEAWEEGGKFEHVLSIGGETYVDYAAMEGRAASCVACRAASAGQRAA